MNTIMIAVNVLVFLLTEITGSSLDSRHLINWGAAYTPVSYTHLRRRLHHQFRDALNALGAGISAGYSLENAVLEAGKDMNRIYGPDREISREMAYMAAQMRVSVPVEKLFYDLGSRSQVEDIRSFSEILAQSKRMGGNMRETIQNCVSIMELSLIHI